MFVRCGRGLPECPRRAGRVSKCPRPVPWGRDLKSSADGDGRADAFLTLAATDIDFPGLDGPMGRPRGESARRLGRIEQGIEHRWKTCSGAIEPAHPDGVFQVSSSALDRQDM